MKHYIVVDTNVIVSSFLAFQKENKQTPPFIVLANIFSPKSEATVLYNDEILKEYKEVLSRPAFKISKSRIGKFINDFKKIAVCINNLPEINNTKEFPDPKDIVFYKVTLSRKPSFLVTGNISHFPAKPFVITPSEYLEILSGRKIEEIRKSKSDNNTKGY